MRLVMETNKKSFIIFKDSLEILDELNDTQVAGLFRAIKDYQNGEKTHLDGVVKIAFIPFRNQFIRDNEKYKKLCVKNKKIAENRYKKTPTTGNQPLPNLPLVTNRDQPLPTVTNKDSGKDSDSEKNKRKEKKIKKEKKKLIDEFSNEMKPVVSAIIEHRKNIGKPIKTVRAVNGLINKLKHYAEHWGITNTEALNYWLSEQWMSIDIDYKYPFRKKEKQKGTVDSVEETEKILQTMFIKKLRKNNKNITDYEIQQQLDQKNTSNRKNLAPNLNDLRHGSGVASVK